MDYEKKYKEALERAEKALEVFGTDKCEGARQIFSLFPELKESEDEKVRKALIRFHKSSIDIDGIKGDDILAWLEKQGEQKSAWSEEDEEELYIAISTLNEAGQHDSAKWLKSLKDRIIPQQKQEWSEEDEERLKSCLNIIQAKGMMGVTDTINTKWLKSLKERIGG